MGGAPVSNPDPVLIREALGDILRSAPFRNSHQCQIFLSHIVDRTLAGETELLRERAIASKVFGRDANYDPREDPVVRVRAAEVRKRLAQYYQNEANRPVRIEVPPGSYRAVFVAKAGDIPKPAAEPGETAETAANPDSAEARPRQQRWTWGWVAAALAVLALGIVPLLALRPGPTELDRFWEPVLSSAKPVLIYNATSKVYRPYRPGPPSDGSAPAPPEMRAVTGRYTCVGDAYTGAVLVSLFSGKGKLYQLRWGSDISFGALRSEPSILIGAFNNDWTLQTTSELRLVFERILAIRDRSDNRLYKLEPRPPDEPMPEDYALVSRVFDSKTGELLIAAGGITDAGTYAAGEFLTSPRAMDQLAARAPADWPKKNLQVLLYTKVVGGTPGPPNIVTAYFW